MPSLIGTLIIGLIVGAIAKLIMPGKDPGGCIITMLLGIAGAFVGNGLARLIGLYEPTGWVHFVLSVIGALILLWVYRLIVRNKEQDHSGGSD
jgi:uncharacterized membrane protein YeaQ/YmgE (transglycosylase-associated protein family)